jgi:hypothetical protein
MADLSDVQRIALALPDTSLDDDRIAFSVTNKGKRKGIAWVWMERIHPKKARVPNLSVLAIRVRDLAEKDMLLAARPSALFTEPHYNGFPAVLIRLAAIDVDELEGLLRNAWRCQAPAALVRSFDEQRGM